MSSEHRAFHVGANCIVLQDGMVLLGLRKRGAGEGKWALPGGHLEWGERLEDAAMRELEEETGLNALSIRYVGAVNDVRLRGDEIQHRFHYQFVVEHFDGAVQNREPDSHYEWRWFPLNQLPENIWEPFADMLRGFIEGATLLDAPRKK